MQSLFLEHRTIWKINKCDSRQVNSEQLYSVKNLEKKIEKILAVFEDEQSLSKELASVIQEQEIGVNSL